MMLDAHIEKIIRECPQGKAPIFYGSVSYYTIGKKKKRVYQTAEKIVMKGNINEILDSIEVKRRVIIKHIGKTKNKVTGEQVQAFDPNKITLHGLIIDKFLSYGVK